FIRVQIHSALRALHEVQLLEAQFLLGGHLRRPLRRPLLAALELLSREIFIFGLAGLFDLGHGFPPEGWILAHSDFTADRRRSDPRNGSRFVPEISAPGPV